MRNSEFVGDAQDCVGRYIRKKFLCIHPLAVEARTLRLGFHADPNWGSITNTSIEGGKPNPMTGESGNWEGTPFQPLYHVCGASHQLAGMFFGSVWKKIIIDRPEEWVGIRFDLTFPQRGITLMGKTYFLPS
jgi:hypothetical protein